MSYLFIFLFLLSLSFRFAVPVFFVIVLSSSFNVLSLYFLSIVCLFSPSLSFLLLIVPLVFFIPLPFSSFRLSFFHIFLEFYFLFYFTTLYSDTHTHTNSYISSSKGFLWTLPKHTLLVIPDSGTTAKISWQNQTICPFPSIKHPKQRLSKHSQTPLTPSSSYFFFFSVSFFEGCELGLINWSSGSCRNHISLESATALKHTVIQLTAVTDWNQHAPPPSSPAVHCGSLLWPLCRRGLTLIKTHICTPLLTDIALS